MNRFAAICLMLGLREKTTKWKWEAESECSRYDPMKRCSLYKYFLSQASCEWTNIPPRAHRDIISRSSSRSPSLPFRSVCVAICYFFGIGVKRKHCYWGKQHWMGLFTWTSLEDFPVNGKQQHRQQNETKRRRKKSQHTRDLIVFGYNRAFIAIV